jgi:hypothetical protein
MNRSRWLAAGLAALFGACGGTEIDQSFPAEAGGTLRADADFGDAVNWDRGTLEVSTHDGQDVQVEAETSGWASWAVRVEAAAEGKDVRLRARVSGPGARWFGGPTLRLRAAVPRDFSVEAKTNGGRIRIRDFAGALRAETEDDDVRVSGAEGAIEIVTRRGRVNVRDVKGSVRASTARSNVEVENVEGSVEVTSEWGSIQVNTASGDARGKTERGSIEMHTIGGAVGAVTDLGDVVLVDVAGPIQVASKRGQVSVRFTGNPAGTIETDTGGITLRLPSDAKLQLDARTRKGTLRLDGVFWLEGDLDDRSGSGTINGGGETLTAHSGTGSIDIDAR